MAGIKVKQFFVTFIFLAILIYTVVCAETESVFATNVGSELLKIAVATDLHIDPKTGDQGVVNPLNPYNMEIADALLWDVADQRADILLLCGDVTNSGRLAQHEALVKKLKEAEEKGLRICIIPGNHDIGEVKPAQFETIYEEFGYLDAYSRDSDSLSYSILLDRLMLLMLDTDGYSDRTDGAYLSDVTLKWMREQLENAKTLGIDVIAVGHYTLLTGQTTEFTGKEEAISIFHEYDVPLYVCGHLHQRNVSVDDQLTELVVEQTISYPCSYAVISKTGENEYRYEPRKIDVKRWAEEHQVTDEKLIDFDEYQSTLFLEKCYDTVIALKGDREVPEEKLDQAIEFFGRMQSDYWEGTLSQNLRELRAHPGYQIFMELAEGKTYGKWLPVFLAQASPYTAGFTLSKGDIERS